MLYIFWKKKIFTVQSAKQEKHEKNQIFNRANLFLAGRPVARSNWSPLKSSYAPSEKSQIVGFYIKALHIGHKLTPLIPCWQNVLATGLLTGKTVYEIFLSNKREYEGL